MNSKKFEELKEIQDKLEYESVSLIEITDVFKTMEIALSEGSSEIPRHALAIPSLVLQQTTDRINKLICDMQTKIKEVTGNAEN